jgi:hypothetical protein
MGSGTSTRSGGHDNASVFYCHIITLMALFVMIAGLGWGRLESVAGLLWNDWRWCLCVSVSV